MEKDIFKYDIVKESSVEKYEELPKHFLADTTEEAEQLYEEFYTLLNNLAYSYSISTNIDKSDLFGEALIGLARAKRDFNPTRSNKFKMFAIYKIKTALNDYVRRNMSSVVIPAYIRRANKHLRLIQDLLQPYGNILRMIVTDGKLDLSSIESVWVKDKVTLLFEKLKTNAEHARISVKELIRRSEFIPVDMAYNEYLTPEDVINKERDKLQLALFIENIKRYMDEREQQVVEMVLDDIPYRAIGDELQISGTTVSNILKGIGEKLRKKGITLEL